MGSRAGGRRIAVGCDLGGTEVKLVVLRDRRITARRRFPTPARATAPEVARCVGSAVAEIGSGFPPAVRTASLGVALPGFLDRLRARPILLSNLPALNGFPLRSALERLTRLPVVLDADSNAGAYGEAMLGAGRGASRILYLSLGTGVGAAMVCGGAIVRVANHTVGQVAHLPLDPAGPRCACGARGCVESVLCARGVLWRAARAVSRGARLPEGALRSPEALAACARRGSRAARRVFAECGALLGAALALLSNFLSPERIVVGGGISRSGSLLLGPAARELERRSHPRLRGVLTLRQARLGPYAGAAGAALLALDHCAP